VNGARKLKGCNGQATVLCIDEVHRFNKSQQDAIRPHVENGTVTLIGATTENPSFEFNAALLSRCRVFRLERLSDEDIVLNERRELIVWVDHRTSALAARGEAEAEAPGIRIRRDVHATLAVTERDDAVALVRRVNLRTNRGARLRGAPAGGAHAGAGL